VEGMSPAIDNPQPPVDNSRKLAIWRALASVTDPEIPVLSVVDMGLIAGVMVNEHGVVVDVTPTFSGCPALAVIRSDVQRAVENIGESHVVVRTVYDPPWTTDRLTDEGRRKLKAFGLAPPGPRCAATEMPSLDRVACPYCDSYQTELESIFGPTLCRSIHYCAACRQSFEHFKTV